jgi:hypothetical protein
MSKTTQKFFW